MTGELRDYLLVCQRKHAVICDDIAERTGKEEREPESLVSAEFSEG